MKLAGDKRLSLVLLAEPVLERQPAVPGDGVVPDDTRVGDRRVHGARQLLQKMVQHVHLSGKKGAGNVRDWRGSNSTRAGERRRRVGGGGRGCYENIIIHKRPGFHPD